VDRLQLENMPGQSVAITVSGLRGKDDGIVAMSMARWQADLFTAEVRKYG